jgi:adenylosuccinate synthase
VDAACLVTTPLHALANRFREAARGSAQHGSTGVGFGETVAYGLDHPASALRAEHLTDPTETFERLVLLRDHLTDQGVVDLTRVTDDSLTTLAGELRDAADTVFDVVEHDRLIAELQTGHTVFEGAQGFWLDENFGFQPHTTWSTTTPANARALLREAGVDDVRAVGCIRTYATRHGAGPLPGEGELAIVPTEPHNNDTDYAGAFRTAAHDPRLLGTAIDLTMVDALAVSHTDVFGTFRTTEGPLPLDAFGPVILVATGPARTDRRHT